jgi:pseudouridine-5'-phosphate glycosidase
MRVQKEVKQALDEGRAVVALESTIIAHGMPFPENLENAQALEEAVKEVGAVPASIAVLEGLVHIGLDAEHLEFLAKEGPAIPKLSTRDLPYALSQRRHGATTVAATMALAHRAGIEVFATGGIGGVHRGGADSFDISADLLELSRTPMAVVCAGAKAILDLPATIEVLETNGVSILGYQTEAFPSFYARDSGLRVDWRMDSPEEVAQLLRSKREMELPAAVLVANPVPEAEALDAQWVEERIQEALKDANQQGVFGKSVTPFLLARMAELTEGRSLTANRALAESNARLAGQIAVALSTGVSVHSVAPSS